MYAIMMTKLEVNGKLVTLQSVSSQSVMDPVCKGSLLHISSHVVLMTCFDLK